MAAALGKRLLQDGKRVGYLKPFSILSSPQEDADTHFIKDALDLKEPLESIEPQAATKEALSSFASSDLSNKLRSRCEGLSQDKDILILEGLSDPAIDTSPGWVARHVADALGTKVVLIVRYRRCMEEGEVIAAAKELQPHLLGVVLNEVPSLSERVAKASMVPSLEKESIPVLAVIPEDRLLLTLSIGELVEHLQGRWVVEPNNADELVEHVMVGALTLDAPGVSGGIEYFKINDNKVVITRGDRPDIQWPAMQTSLRCLILTNNIEPIPYVLDRAKERKMPIAVVEKDTLDTMAELNGILTQGRFNQVKKVDRLLELMEDRFDFDALYRGLGN